MADGPNLTWAHIARRIRVPVGFAFALLYLWLAKPTVASMLLGAGFIIAGLVIRALSSGHVKKNQQLTTSGPYAYVRNPLYLGSLVLAFGFALAARSGWVAVGLFFIFAAIYLPVIRAEERLLSHHFPDFDEYARKVPRLLPRVSPFEGGQGSFSWDLYLKHREYNATAGATAMIAALAIKLYLIK